MASNNDSDLDQSVESNSSELIDNYLQFDITNELKIPSQITLEESLFSDPLEPSRLCKETDVLCVSEEDSETTVSLNSDAEQGQNLATSVSTETIDSITSSEISIEHVCSLSEDSSNLHDFSSPEQTDSKSLESEPSIDGNVTQHENPNSTEYGVVENSSKDNNENPIYDEIDENIRSFSPPLSVTKDANPKVARSTENVLIFDESEENIHKNFDSSIRNMDCKTYPLPKSMPSHTPRADCRTLFSRADDNFIFNKPESRKTTVHPLLEDYSLNETEEKLEQLESHDDDDVVNSLDDASNAIGAIKKRSKTESNSKQRRVSFPEDDTSLITSYLEPVDPWNEMSDVTNELICKAYKESCERHRTSPLPVIMQQIAALPLSVGGRVECLNLKGQKLDTSQCECLEEILRRVQFKTLNFESCDLDDDSVIILFDMIEFYDSGTQLNIACNNKISQRGWQACARLLKRSPSIDLINAHSTDLSEQTMLTLARTLRLGTRLTCLHLENCNLTGRSIIVLSGALRLNDLLKELYLSDNQLGSHDCIHIENLLRANRNIQLLDIRNNNIQDAGCVHVCSGVLHQSKDESASGLKTLVLWNNHLTMQSVTIINHMLQGTKHLQTLNLGKNKLGAAGVLLMKNSLIRNRTLLRLGLQSTRITDEGAVALAEYIADNTVIERIDLRENNIKVAGLMALSQSFRINKTVLMIDLDLNASSESSNDLAVQHSSLFTEIKEACQKNQTEAHLKESRKTTESETQSQHLSLQPVKEDNCERKISLTCESFRLIDDIDNEHRDGEPKRYRSPAPSPSISPCPSPSPHPFSSTTATNNSRFKVFKVCEPYSVATTQTSDILSTSAPPSFSLLNANPRPNRFTGGRFTVTKVTERPSRSLPNLTSRTMSSPAFKVSACLDTENPVVVVSSPNNNNIGLCVDSSPIDEVFESPNTPTNPILESQSLDATAGIIENLFASAQKDFNDEDLSVQSKRKAPLASVEGSFDTDSEDSEPTPQSSDSAYSEEVRLEPQSNVAWSDSNKLPVVKVEDQ